MQVPLLSVGALLLVQGPFRVARYFRVQGSLLSGARLSLDGLFLSGRPLLLVGRYFWVKGRYFRLGRYFRGSIRRT